MKAGAVLVDAPDYAAMRSAAVIRLCEAVGTRLGQTRARDADAAEEMLAALRACGAVRIAVSDPIQPPTTEACTAAIALGGDCVGLVLSRIRTQTADPAPDAIDAQLLAAGESTTYFALQAHDRLTARPGSRTPTDLAGMLAEGKLRELRNEAVRVFGPASELVDRFAFPADRFIRPESRD